MQGALSPFAHGSSSGSSQGKTPRNSQQHQPRSVCIRPIYSPYKETQREDSAERRTTTVLVRESLPVPEEKPAGHHTLGDMIKENAKRYKTNMKL